MITYSPKDYPEDRQLYQTRCATCEHTFLGSKHRFICNQCKPVWHAAPELRTPEEIKYEALADWKAENEKAMRINGGPDSTAIEENRRIKQLLKAKP